MATKPKLESMRDLRSALVLCSLIVALLATLLLVVDYFVKSAVASLALSSLAAAGFSIVGALIVTEFVLKPLYIRDILQTANLSSEIHHAGIRAVRSISGVDWRSILAGTEDISIAAGNENVLRSGPWTSVMEAARSGKRQVLVHLSKELADSNLPNALADQWRGNGCKESGSKLFVIPHDKVTQGLVVERGEWIVASIAGDPLNDDPILFVLSDEVGDDAVKSLKRGMARMNASDTTPIAGA